MAKRLTPEEKGRMEPEAAGAERGTPTWLWTMVALIVLVTFAGGGIAGFLGGRLYERNHSRANFPDTYWLLGAQLADRDGGVILETLYPGWPAHIAGLQDGDRLVSLDGEPTNSAGQARRILSRYAPGNAVLVTYERNHRFGAATVILGIAQPLTGPPLPPEPVIITLPPVQGGYQEARLGVYYRMLIPGDPFAVSEGALILTLLEGSTPAEEAGLRPGDIITQVGSETITQSNTLGDALSRFSAGERVTLRVDRAGQEMTVTVRPGG